MGSKSEFPWGWVVLGTVGLGAALLLAGGGAAVLADNPSYYKLAADANREAERAIARARKARGTERARELNEAERLVRQAVEYGKLAGDKWLSYETSSGKEEIERLRGRADNPTSVAKAQRLIREIADREGLTLEQAARRFVVYRRRHADDVMDRIGSWPSSEPELAALQRVW